MTGAYSYQIGGPPIPSGPQNIVINQIGDTMVFSWSDVNDPGVLGFDIYYAPQDIDINLNFESAFLLTTITRATEVTTAKIPPGNWNLWIVTHDLADQISETVLGGGIAFTVNNNNTVLYSQINVPTYARGPRIPFFAHTDFITHWTGVLIPRGLETCDFYVPIPAPDLGDVTLDMAAGGNFDDTTYYFTFTYVTAGGETLPSLETSLFVPAGNLPTAFIPASAMAPSCEGWNVYVSTTSTTETKQNADVLGFNPFFPIGSAQQDQIWQMPITGLIAGAAQPTTDTTGWEVFNVFVPDPVFSQGFSPALLDSGVTAKKRVWITCELVPGPGQIGVLTDHDHLNLILWYSDLNTFSFGNLLNGASQLSYFTTGFVNERYLLGEILANVVNNYVFYVKNFQITVDNPQITTPVNNVSISSAGTTVNFSDYGLTYHQPPNVQVTPASSAATGGNAAAVTSSNALVTLYTSTGSVAGVANLSVTGV